MERKQKLRRRRILRVWAIVCFFLSLCLAVDAFIYQPGVAYFGISAYLAVGLCIILSTLYRHGSLNLHGRFEVD